MLSIILKLLIKCGVIVIFCYSVLRGRENPLSHGGFSSKPHECLKSLPRFLNFRIFRLGSSLKCKSKQVIVKRAMLSRGNFFYM